jgi:ATP-dependent DNA helicase PIF1
MTKIEINSKFADALDLLENSNSNIFITGQAGTGKSTLLQHFRSQTKKNIVVLAPTGVAALNVLGQTIHSFFGFPPGITPKQAGKEHPFDDLKKIISKLHLVVIDEASMLRADLLDSIDQALRQYGRKGRPFGGLRVAFIGDLYQLPPVLTSSEKEEFFKTYASPYFFDAKVFQENGIETVELQKIYRQSDEHFITILNAIRDNTVTPQHLQNLNKQHNKMYQAFQIKGEITLCTTNAAANTINAQQLQNLKGKLILLNGETHGKFTRQLPTEQKLAIKRGAQIMMVNNDSAKRWVNGSMGMVTAIKWNEEQDCEEIHVTLDNGKKVEVLPYTWESNNYYYSSETESIETETVGNFTQYPVKLAWAVTIHKGQGKTFKNVVVDIGNGAFVHGQVYVALSRCTGLEGLILRKPILQKHIWTDYRITHFLSNESHSDPSLTAEEKKRVLERGIDNETTLNITYIKSNGQRLQKSIRPIWIGEMEYNGTDYLAVQALEDGQTKSYSISRIMSVEEIPNEKTT